LKERKEEKGFGWERVKEWDWRRSESGEKGVGFFYRKGWGGTCRGMTVVARQQRE